MIQPKENIKTLNRMKDIGNDRSNFIRLDKNERTIPFPDDIWMEMIGNLKSGLLPMYPDQTLLYQKLANHLHVDEANLLLTAGSDAAIKCIYETYISENDKVIFLDPTYAMIEVYADMFGANKIKIGYDSELRLDYEKLKNSLTSDVKALFIANPNQPTGTILEDWQIRELLQITMEKEILIIFDEAYHLFSGKTSSAEFISEYSNLIVTSTFSKAYGVASIRLGFIITQKVNIDYLYKVKPYSDINLLAVKVGEYLVDNFNIIQNYIDEVTESKKLIKNELSHVGIEVVDSFTNFIHIRLGHDLDPKKIADELKNNNFLVRTTGMGLPAVLEGCIRITVGPVEQMKEFLYYLERIIKK